MDLPFNQQYRILVPSAPIAVRTSHIAAMIRSNNYVMAERQGEKMGAFAYGEAIIRLLAHMAECAEKAGRELPPQIPAKRPKPVRGTGKVPQPLTGRQTFALTLTDLQDLCRAARKQLVAGFKGAEAPRVYENPTLLMESWNGLIGNLKKSSFDKHGPDVAQLLSETLRFAVRFDQIAGVNLSLRERAWALDRLSPGADDYEGWYILKAAFRKGQEDTLRAYDDAGWREVPLAQFERGRSLMLDDLYPSRPQTGRIRKT